MPSKEKIFKRERNRWLISLKRFENKMSKDLIALFNAEIEKIIKNNDISILQKIAFENNLKSVLSKTLKNVVEFSAKTVTKQINFEIKADFEYLSYFEDWIASQAFNEIIGTISDNFFDDITKIITDALLAELTREKITEILQEQKQMTKFRAERIARTETHKASSYTAENRAKDISAELGIKMLKQWIPVSDARTRSNHSAMRDAPVIGIDEMFNVGGEKMSRPNDPNASASNVINCRCVMRFIPQ